MSGAGAGWPLPKTVGRYEILGALGRGTMGAVYRAQDPVLGRVVALKVIDLALSAAEAGGAGFEERFLTEARLAAQLQHPAIVVVHDFGRDVATGTLFMAMEYLQGRTLEQALREHPLEWREALRIGERVALGLEHAHQNGIVHRDVKPANIMLLPSGEPKIMDFGIAKAPASTLTAAGQVFGTPAYMSPEQALGEAVDARSDVFSLGAVLYQLVTGERPFEAPTLPRLFAMVVQEDPRPPRERMPGLPADVDSLVGRALAKAPGDRYPSAQALAEDIADVLASRAPRHGAGGSPRSQRRETDPTKETTRLKPAPSAELPARDTGDTLEAELRSLVSTARPPTLPAPPRRTLTVVPETPPARATSAPSRFKRPLWIAGSGLLVLLFFATAIAHLWRRPVEVVQSLLEPARLELTFEHHLKSGNLKLYVDDELVLDEDLSGRVTKSLLGVELRTGWLQKAVDVRPGRHELRAAVRWGDGGQTERIWGSFEAGKPRRLYMTLGRIRKDLSLERR